MTKEQAIEILKRFKDNEMQGDKLEIDNRCGGWKVGRIYKSLELNIAIEIVLYMLEEQEELINTLVDYIAKEDIDELVCKHIKCVDNEEEKECRECVKKFFESKIKESEE